MKRNTLLYAFSLLCTAGFVALQLYDPGVLREHIESKTYDLRLYFKNIVSTPQKLGNILIVSVDEKSIAEVGHWPWDWSTMASLVETVSSGSPSAIGIDILYSEAESPEGTTSLARAIQSAGNVALATGFILNPSGKAQVREAEYIWDHAFMKVKSTKDIPWKDWAVKPQAVLPPQEELSALPTALGSVYSQPDRDGTLRWEVLYLFYEEDYYPSLPLQVARIYQGLPMEDLTLLGGTGVKLGQQEIATDLSGRALINYLGADGTFTYIPASDVLAGRISPSTFRDKAVFIGTSALATYDHKVTPLSGNYPGVEKNATVLHNILHSSFVTKSPGVLEMGLTVITALFLSFFLKRVRALRGALVAFVLISSYGALAFYLFIQHLFWLNLMYPSLNMFTIFVAETTVKYFFEERRSREIKDMFSNYVSPRVVDALIENPQMARLGGERREITVLFSDIAGFTSLSENMRPEDVVSLLNEYFKEMTDVIFHWEGTFDKIVGDEIMAFWNAPVLQDDHAERSVRCALSMHKTLLQLHRKWEKEGKPLIRFGIGINTGEVLVGNIGAEDKKMDYTIIGDHVNAGARVEALTRQFNATILITEFTAEYIIPLINEGRFGHVELAFREAVKVKGKEKLLGIYELRDTNIEEGGERRRKTNGKFHDRRIRKRGGRKRREGRRKSDT